MDDGYGEMSSSHSHQLITNQKEVKRSGCNGAHVENELESGSSNERSDFDPAIASDCYADGSDFNQSIDSSCSTDPPPPNFSAKLLPKQK